MAVQIVLLDSCEFKRNRSVDFILRKLSPQHRHRNIVVLIEESRHGDEHCRLRVLTVLQQFLDIPVVEGDPCTSIPTRAVHESLENVRKRQV